jgi:hypothetical protein
MKALTLRQPWAYLIIHGPKRIENRRWNTHFRGRFFIHTSKIHTQKDHDLAEAVASRYWVRLPKRGSPAYQCGGIIGSVELVDVMPRWSPDVDWKFEGQYGFVLQDPRPVDFIPCNGRLNFWTVPEDDLYAAIKMERDTGAPTFPPRP